MRPNRRCRPCKFREPVTPRRSLSGRCSDAARRQDRRTQLRGWHDARASDPGPPRSALSGADRCADRAPGDAERGHRGRAPKRGVPRHGAQGRGDRKVHACVRWGHAPRAVPRKGKHPRLPALASPPTETASQEPQAEQVQQDRNRARQARRNCRAGRTGP